MKSLWLLVGLLVLGACSTQVSKRNLASEKQYDDSIHDNYRGQFDHQN